MPHDEQTLSQGQSDLVGRLSTNVLHILADAIVDLTKDHPASADYGSVCIGDRLEKKLKTVISGAISTHGLRNSLSHGPTSGVFVPYVDHLEASAPGLHELLKNGEVDLVDLANGEMGSRLIPMYLVQELFDENNDGNLHVPYNRMLPYSAKSLNASFWGVKADKIKGDRARGMPLGDFWKALCPPYGASGVAGETARFNLTTAILTLRKAGSAPFVQHLDDTFYYEHEDNTIGVGKERFSFSGPGFMGAKHVAEIWNGLVHTVYGNPMVGSKDHTAVQSMLYTDEDVGATLCAISTALLHDVDCRNAKQADMFFCGRDCDIRGCEKSRVLKRPVCFLTGENKEHCMRLFAEFKEQAFDSAVQDKPEQRVSQAAADVLKVSENESVQWGHPQDRVVKLQYENSRFKQANSTRGNSRKAANTGGWNTIRR